MEYNLLEDFKHVCKDWEIDKRRLSPLQLAYVGDAVYELFVRTYLLGVKDASVNELHKEAVKYVKAKAQADIIHFLEQALTEEEWAIVKRGRNAKSGSVPKNAKLQDYRYATGFETLVGYLYLEGNHKRIYEIFAMIIQNQSDNYGKEE